nr:hypothetical protein CFP56_29952 [Quercus suber]
MKNIEASETRICDEKVSRLNVELSFRADLAPLPSRRIVCRRARDKAGIPPKLPRSSTVASSSCRKAGLRGRPVRYLCTQGLRDVAKVSRWPLLSCPDPSTTHSLCI